MELTLFGIAYPVTSLGPGERVALWVAGCSKRCPGCITPQLLTARSGHVVSVDVLLSRLLALPAALHGVTISGGEPTDQAPAIAELAKKLRRRRSHWTFISYSGYTLAEVRNDARRSTILEAVDVLIDGPFAQRVAPTHPLAGSGNQVVQALTPRGAVLRDEMRRGNGTAFNLGVGATSDVLIGVSSIEQRRAVHRRLGLTKRPALSEPL
mgnify:CR=1 FL=1